MPKIDFLGSVSDSTGKKRAVPIGKLVAVPLCLGIGSIILVFLSIYLGIVNLTYAQRMTDLDKKARQADVSIDKVKALILQKDTLTRQVNVLDGFLKKTVAWSVKLKQLQYLIPQEVWLTKLSFEAKNISDRNTQDKSTESLLLKGNLIPSEGINFLGALSNFVNILKEDKDFYGGFDNLILAKSSSQPYKNVATMAFEILLPVKTQ